MNNTHFLIDCGLHQERELRGRDWDPFHIPPKTLDAVLLTHAHVDHCGLLPKLVRDGFHHKIYCTPATAEMAEITLLDTAKILEEDAEFKRRRHKREGRKGPFPEIPLFTGEQAKVSLPLFSPVRYGKSITLAGRIETTFYDAGHILGSSMVRVTIREHGKERTILFSGDIGRWNKPILKDPTLFEEADYIVIESTYGDRTLESPEKVANKLGEMINATVKAGGNIVIPSFAVERTQELLYYLNKLLIEDRIPHLMVFVDSPMAVNVTEVFEHHPELFDEEMLELLHQQKSPFNFPGLNLTRTVDESKGINYIKGSVIIIAGSGMCTSGRIKHHLVTNISRPESTILFVGYQAMGTLGRQIVDGAKEVRILGQYYPVKANTVQISGFSAHADRDELLKWLSHYKKPPRRLFIIHGESNSSHHFATLVTERMGWETSVPNYKDEFLLD